MRLLCKWDSALFPTLGANRGAHLVSDLLSLAQRMLLDRQGWLVSDLEPAAAHTAPLFVALGRMLREGPRSVLRTSHGADLVGQAEALLAALCAALPRQVFADRQWLSEAGWCGLACDLLQSSNKPELLLPVMQAVQVGLLG